MKLSDIAGFKGLLSDEDLFNINQNAGLERGLALLAASGPSTNPNNIGQVLLSGLRAGQGAEQTGLQNALAQSQLQQQMAQQAQRKQILSGLGDASQQALADGGGPTMANAEKLGGNMLDRLKQGYAAALSVGDLELAKTLADQIKSQQFKTQSVQELMIDGKPKKFALGEDGSMKELGVAPEDLIQVDVGGQKLLVGKTTGKQLAQYNVTMTPAEKDASAVRWQTLNQGNFEYVQPNKEGGPAGVFNKKTGQFQAMGTAAPKDVQTVQTAASAIVEAANAIPKSTGSGVGALRDIGAGFLGVGTEGAKNIAKLSVIGAKLVQNVPRFEGPQSNADVENYKQAAGDVANPKKPPEVRLAALQEVAKLIAKDAQVKGIALPPELQMFTSGGQNIAPMSNMNDGWSIKPVGK